MVTALLPFEGVGKAVRLVFAGLGFECMEIFLDEYREAFFSVNWLFVRQGYLPRACPFPDQPFRY